MAVDFPSSPTPGQVYTQAGATWTWDGVKWVAQGTGTGIYLPLAGGTMTGDITLKGDPSAPLHPVTYRMVSNPNDNRICNGDMRIDQRNGGASGTAVGGVYTVDRWNYSGNAAIITWGRNLNAVAGPPGFPYYLGFQSSSAHVSAAGDVYAFYQPIEADMVSDLAFGAAGAQPVTLSFWVRSSLTGTFSGALQNTGETRSYPFIYSILTANVWTKIAVTIPGDTTGTWPLSGNAVGLYLMMDLGMGSNFRGPANAWASGNYYGATGAVSFVGTNGASFYVTGVKLEIGSVATPFNRQSLAKSMADCQRYYQTSYYPGASVGAATQLGNINHYITGLQNVAAAETFPVVFPVVMRTAPTVTLYSPITGASGKVRDNANNADVTASASGTPSAGSFLMFMTMSAAGATINWLMHYTASAEL